MTRTVWTLCLGVGLISGLFAQTTHATIPYTPVVWHPSLQPGLGPGVIDARLVFGKEYSHDFDSTTVGGVALPPPPTDPEQVVIWDGMGGTDDGIDYSLTRPVDFPREQEVDALANSNDALYRRLREDLAHLIFSHDDVVGVYPAGGGPMFVPGLLPSTGPVGLSNGNVIGGTGDLSVEESGVYSGAPPEIQHSWTPAALINGMPEPTDIDSIEVWGPEPGIVADSDKYSLESDVVQAPGVAPGVSVFHYVFGGGPSVPYISHPMIVSAVESLLGVAPATSFNQYDQAGRNAINLDALMVQDVDGVIEQFGPGDSIIFSISQIVDPQDPMGDGYYATGSELFHMEMTAAGGPVTTYLKHGAHEWSHLYTLGAMAFTFGADQRAYIDINAIEAVGALVVPEPSAFALLACGLIGAWTLYRRK